MDSFEKFKDIFPSKDKFYILLSGHGISDKYYDPVVNVWKTFEMKNIKHYHDLYLKGNVLLLAEVCLFLSCHI